MAMDTAKEKESKGLMLPTKSPTLQNPEPETEEADRFNQSLRELKDLRSQLYHAADSFEIAFLKTAHKKILLENTKKYVGEAIVTVVDHLGTVSSNLEQRVYGGNKISKTEQRIDCLNQRKSNEYNQMQYERLLTCQQYAHTLGLSSLLWSSKCPRQHRHYVSPLAKKIEQSIDISRGDTNNSNSNATDTSPSKKAPFTGVAWEPISGGNSIVKPPVTCSTTRTELTTVIPVFESPSRLLKLSNTSFGSPAQGTFELGSNNLKKKTFQGSSLGSSLLSFLRKSRRKTSKGLSGG